MTLSDKVFIITGASRGIGLATAQLLAESGARVYGVSRQTSKPSKLRSGITLLRADVRIRSEVNQAVKTVIDESGHVDVLINNAGMECVKPLDETTDQEYDEILGTNLKGAFYFTTAVLPGMRRKKIRPPCFCKLYLRDPGIHRRCGLLRFETRIDRSC